MAGPLERVEFEGAILQGAIIPGDRIQGYLAKPEGAGPFPAVIGLHGCARMPDTTKRKLVDELVGWGYVVPLVDSFATRGIDHACTGGVPDISGKRRSDAYGALAFLAGQTFVDPQRVAAVGFSQGGWVTLLVADEISFELFVRSGFWTPASSVCPASRRCRRPKTRTIRTHASAGNSKSPPGCSRAGHRIWPAGRYHRLDHGQSPAADSRAGSWPRN